MRLRQVPDRLGRAGSRVAPAAKAVDRFYLSPEWRALAERLKRERGYICDDPGHRGGRSAVPSDLIADHVVERRDGGADLDESNVRIICRACHNRKTAAARAGRNRAARPPATG